MDETDPFILKLPPTKKEEEGAADDEIDAEDSGDLGLGRGEFAVEWDQGGEVPPFPPFEDP